MQKVYNIFISYAHVDNELELYIEKERFVSSFKQHLENCLASRFGRKEYFKIWFDQERLDGNAYLSEEIKKEIEKSDFFIPVLSTGYIESNWCKEELDIYIKTHPKEEYSNIFPLQLVTFDKNQKPDDIKDIIGFSLTKKFPERKEFLKLVDDMAEKITKYTKYERKEDNKETIKSKESIFLADVTDDLEDKRQEIERYLIDFGYEVYPKYDYSLSADEFKKTTRDDIKKCKLFIQLIGKIKGKRPVDLEEGYIKAQFDIAKDEKIEILQWSDNNLDIKDIEDTIQKELLSSEFLIKTNLQDFKKRIISKLNDLEKKEVKVKQIDSCKKMQDVFINAVKEDKNIAEQIMEVLSKNCFAETLPYDEDISVREIIEDSVVSCHYYILIFGNAKKEWVNGQLRHFKKLYRKRKEDIKSVIVCKTPPKSDKSVTIKFPFLKQIESENNNSLIENLEKLILSNDGNGNG